MGELVFGVIGASADVDIRLYANVCQLIVTAACVKFKSRFLSG